MMYIILNLLIITLVVINIVDISGFIDSLKKLIWRMVKGKNIPYRTFRMKPFDCSYCLTFWICLAYLVLGGTGLLSVGMAGTGGLLSIGPEGLCKSVMCVALPLLFAWLSPYLRDFQLFLGDLFQKIINWLNGLL